MFRQGTERVKALRIPRGTFTGTLLLTPLCLLLTPARQLEKKLVTLQIQCVKPPAASKGSGPSGLFLATSVILDTALTKSLPIICASVSPVYNTYTIVRQPG